MKRKNWIALLTALTMLAALLTGCGSSMAADNSVAMPEMAPEAPAMDVITDMSTVGTATTTYAEQKLIKTVRMETETEDLEALMAQLVPQIESLGGYVENQEIYNGSSYSSYRYRHAVLTIRIPAENLEGFVGQVQTVSNVVTYSESVEDVTLTYVDTESRIAALETELNRLLELLAQAENMSDLLQIEARIGEVQYALESANSQLRVLANKVNYATVNLEINQVTVYTDVEEPTVWQRISKGFGRNLENMGENLVDFFVWVVTYSPQLVIWAVVITLGVITGRKIVRKRKAAKIPKPQENDEK